MEKKLNAVIVLCRCRRHRLLFGIRFEEKNRERWVADWAFPIKEQAARRERFDATDIVGSFVLTEAYPGCPGCRAFNVFRCSCGKVACWDNETKRVTCPWCNQSGMLDGVVDRLAAGGDA
jgi:hypothetical protein